MVRSSTQMQRALAEHGDLPLERLAGLLDAHLGDGRIAIHYRSELFTARFPAAGGEVRFAGLDHSDSARGEDLRRLQAQIADQDTSVFSGADLEAVLDVQAPPGQQGERTRECVLMDAGRATKPDEKSMRNRAFWNIRTSKSENRYDRSR